MPKITRDQVKVPVDVAPEARETYIDNYMAADARNRSFDAVRMRSEGGASQWRFLR